MPTNTRLVPWQMKQSLSPISLIGLLLFCEGAQPRPDFRVIRRLGLCQQHPRRRCDGREGNDRITMTRAAFIGITCIVEAET